MKNRITLNTVLKLLKTMSTPISTWPLPADASRASILKRDIYRGMVIIHAAILTGFIVYDICLSISRDIEHGIAVSAEFTAAMATLTSITLCQVEEARFRVRYQPRLFHGQAYRL